ncbi:MAG: Bis(5'-nucleosyl)-tetraphosphatase (asymmetrical) [uncultured Nocardioidaceae bacterium]|uniref:Bis(5'-nucleosyl)-tetraphosphatase (Asymmetrical) n=1 Tax=uncultured Nocardioidaceae bacterium TaxID=253824 RepID=A0A6J4MCY7_9ACTN|nr:MAG: Bis(5'-nucleosyl)-tetraphosphatase (asymmetrical) [uncultured Nocardioidaceae bacterium]
MTDGDGNCLFCAIVARDVPADVVLETEASLAFRDINAQAPTHVLVIPKTHQPHVAALAEHEPAALADLMACAAAVADAEGLDGHYRLVFNTGSQVGQSVFHVHGHVLGGRPMGWPPG